MASPISVFRKASSSSLMTIDTASITSRIPHVLGTIPSSPMPVKRDAIPLSNGSDSQKPDSFVMTVSSERRGTFDFPIILRLIE
ncbi:Uncharacterised protein [Mycobacteroides abscessus subsp. abscessus]|nr:Uncharacterised protein [Mycobacteroides abscessus subsp. abscessus]